MVHLHLPATLPGTPRSTCSHCPSKPHGVLRPRQQWLVSGNHPQLVARGAWSPHVDTRPTPLVASSSSSMPSTSEPASAHEQHMDNEASRSAAWQLLQDFTLKQFKGLAQPMVATKAARDKLRAAVLLAYSSPHPPANWMSAEETGLLMGITASEARLAVRALRDWCQALDVPFFLPDVRSSDGSSSTSSSGSEGPTADASNATPSSSSSLAAVRGPVYLKYNSKTALCYVTPFRGNDKGVLVQLGQVQVGFLPLGLWDEGMTQPPPAV